MNTLRIAQAALATILAVGINSTTYAFMAAPVEESTEMQVDLTEMVNALQEEIDAGETSCEDMLVKLDAALEDIDAALDAGVPNEDEYLEARDAVSKMRYDLECLAQELTVDLGMPAPAMGPITTSSVAPMGPPAGSSCSTCSRGGGGGGKGGHAGGAGWIVLGGGAAVAIALGADGSDSDFPGVITSPSN